MAEKEYITLTLDKEVYDLLKAVARTRSANEKKDLTIQDLVREAIDAHQFLKALTQFNQLQRLLKPVDGIKVEQTPEGTLVSPQTGEPSDKTLSLLTQKELRTILNNAKDYAGVPLAVYEAENMRRIVEGRVPIPLPTLPQVDVSVFDTKVVSPFGPHSNFSDGEKSE